MGLIAKRNSIFRFLVIFLISLFIFFNLTNIFIFKHHNTNESKILIDKSVNSSAPLTPSGIRITAVNDSSNSMVITWYTTESATDPKVEYSTEPNLIDSVIVDATEKFIDPTYVYSSNLVNLQSNTTYYYNISSDTSHGRKLLNFTTMPLRNATSLKFLLFGDSRTNRTSRSELVNKIMENFDDIEFTVHTGDIVGGGSVQTQWNEYFDDVEILTKKIPGYYIEGNHEQKSQNMYDNIPLPSNELNSYYYNFSIGPINFIGLNTERDISVQTTWLEEVLKSSYKDNNSLWNIAYMHQPIFGSYHPDRSDLISAWCPLFEEYNLDLVFAGHNHYYERSYPMNSLKQYDDSSSYNFENPSNPMYLITGGAGAPLYIRDTNPDYAPFYNSIYHFVIIDINVDDIKEETTLNLETWAMPNDYSGIYLIDNMTIVKKGAFLNIHSPGNNQLCGKVAPNFNISINKIKLKPTWFTKNTSWYTIDGGTTNFTFTGSTGKINQSAWELQPNGTVNIQFYVNDSLGNIDSNSVVLRKDITLPNITILNPLLNQLFGKDAPNFSLFIDESNLNLTWYTVDGGTTNFTFTGSTGKINQIVWNSNEDGTLIMEFYANDTLGNIGSSKIMIRKDTKAPNITVIFPQVNEIYGSIPPNFTVIISDYHLDSMWYSFNESDVNIIFNKNSTINKKEWDKLPNGKFKLIFYANDSVGNIAFEEILLKKNVSEKNNLTEFFGALISFFIVLMIGGISYIYIELKRRKNRKI